jgi:23S rRNA (uracil1939-C5)-methyltransferase
MPAMAAPARTGTLEVTSLSHDGRGVAHEDGKAVFVAGALPGELVRVSRRRRRRNYDECETDAIERASADRVTPRCAHFGVCGGCVLQHLDPAAQITLRQAQLLEELRRIGGVEPARVLEPLTAAPWHYRRRARLGVRWVAKKGRVLVGFRERLSPYLADLRRCEVLTPPLDSLIEPLAGLVGSLSIRSRVPQIEAAVADNAVALVFRVLEPPTTRDRELLSEFARRHGLQIHLQRGGLESVEALAGGEPLRYRLDEFDLEFEFLPTDFIQVNGALNRLMVLRALELLAPEPQAAVLDLFCGIGNFSLPLARRARHVTGIEGERGLVERARANAIHNRLTNTEFHVADLGIEGLQGAWTAREYDAVLLDPPRAGARAILPFLGRSRARRVVYISCHPGSFARDAGLLVQELGFRLVAAGVMDMFPHTAHVESLALFER